MSSMKEHIINPYKLFSKDENLLRLLYYTSDPLSPKKENILDKPVEVRAPIIHERIKFTPFTSDLTPDKKICRILFSPDNRFPNSNSYVMSDQDINVDIFVHADYNDRDLRLSWLCDYINELLIGKHITGIGKMQFRRGRRLPAPEDYIGYQLVYRVGDSR